MTVYLGELIDGGTHDFKFTTVNSSGVPTQLAGSPSIGVYKDNNTAEDTTAPTLTVDFDGRTGLNHVRLVLTDGFYVVDTDYQVVITAGTVSGDSVVGYVVAQFSIANRETEADVVKWLGTAVATPTVAGVPEIDMTHLEGVAQSVSDLKDFADEGYDPATNKVQGVVLVDTTTTNTDVRGTDNAALASVLGALADAAAAGDPTSADTLMQYMKQIINTLEGTVGIPTYPASADPANDVSLAEAIRAIRDDVTAIAGAAMRGTDGVDTATMRGTDGVDTATMRGTDGVDTATMRGTDSAALASVLGALADVAAAGDPTSADTIMQYLKQIINTLEGTVGIPTYPAAADPANDVSLAEAIRAIRDDVTGIAGVTMRGTDDAALATVATEDRLAELDAANLPTTTDDIKTETDKIALTDAGAGVTGSVIEEIEDIPTTAMRGTDDAALATVATEARLAELDPANLPTTTDDIESDTQDIQARLPAALVSGRMDSDAVAISGSTEAADNLEASAETIVTGAAIAGTLSTTEMTTDLTEATNDHFNGRVIIWTSGVLQDQATDITDYDGASKKLVYTQTTEAPSIGDTFNIV